VTKLPDNPRKALGRGLSSLLPSRPASNPGGHPAAPTPSAAVAVEAPPEPTVIIKEVEVVKEVIKEVEVIREVAKDPSGEPLRVSIQDVEPNPLQPRTVFQPDRLQELADSIRANGIIQPLIVRPKGDKFELIAGERRWRASKLAGLETVPVVVQAFVDDRVLEVSLIENIQREDLNPMEIAHAFDRLNRQLGLTHEQIANRTGKERATVTNMIRLLRLPGPVQILLAEHKLTMGHARALLGLGQPEQQVELAEKIAAQGLTVRQVEKTVAKLTEPAGQDQETGKEKTKTVDPNVKAAIDDLERHLGTRVKVVEKSAKTGRIEIEYYSMEDLDRIYGLLVGDKA
jgi:ParB family transcriptional regulator, chromosome partitioning protein